MIDREKAELQFLVSSGYVDRFICCRCALLVMILDVGRVRNISQAFMNVSGWLFVLR